MHPSSFAVLSPISSSTTFCFTTAFEQYWLSFSCIEQTLTPLALPHPKWYHWQQYDPLSSTLGVLPSSSGLTIHMQTQFFSDLTTGGTASGSGSGMYSTVEYSTTNYTEIRSSEGCADCEDHTSLLCQPCTLLMNYLGSFISQLESISSSDMVLKMNAASHFPSWYWPAASCVHLHSLAFSF